MDDLQMTTVESSNIRSYGYATEKKLLRVEFTNGSRYDYVDVPAEVAESFANNTSRGRFFNNSIRGHYQCTKIEHPPITGGEP